MPPPLPPNNERDLIPLDVFPNQGRGAFHGVTHLGMDGTLPEGYDRTINMDVGGGRLLRPALAPQIGGLRLYAGPPSFLVSWLDGSDVPMAIYPKVELGAGGIEKYQNQARGNEGDATTAEYGTAAFYDEGGGTAFLYAGTTTGSKYLNKRTRAGSWSEDGDVVAIHVVASAGALWRTTNDYQVSKCPAGSNPFTVGDWGSSIQVGTNEAKIIRGGAIGAAPIWFKEDGIWVYNEGQNRFQNQYEVEIDADHFPFVKPDGEGGLFTATADGSIVRIYQWGRIITLGPRRNKATSRDTPRGPIKDMEVYGDRIFAFMDASYRLQQPSGLTVLKTVDNFSSFTDYSANVIDGKHSTVAILDSLDTLANGDALLVGFDDQFLGVHFLVTAANANNAALSVHLSDGEGSWDADAIQMRDLTSLHSSTGVASRFLDHTGDVLIRIGEDDFGTWVKATYDGNEKYWLRFTVSAALDAEVEVAEVSIIPKRGAPAFSTTNLDNGEFFEASGMLPKILIGKIEGEEVVWDDLWTLQDVGPAGRLVVSTMPTNNSPKRSLFAVTATNVNVYPLPFGADMAAVDYPILARDTGSTVIPPVFHPSAIELGGYHELVYVEVFGQDFTTETDSESFTFRWDETNDWATEMKLAQSYALFGPLDKNFGTVLHSALMILDGAATDPVGPSVRRIRLWLRRRDDILPGMRTQDARATPEST